jgi:hypothetical protein
MAYPKKLKTLHTSRRRHNKSNCNSNSVDSGEDSSPSSSPSSPDQPLTLNCSENHDNESCGTTKNNAPLSSTPSSMEDCHNRSSCITGNSEKKKGKPDLHMKDHDIEAISSLLMLKGPTVSHVENSSSTQSELTPPISTSGKKRDVIIETQVTRSQGTGTNNTNDSSPLTAAAIDVCCHKCAKCKADNYKMVHDIIRIQTKKYDSWRKNKDRLMRSEDFRMKKGYLEIDKKHMNSILSSLSKYHGKGEMTFIPFELHHDIAKLSESTVGMTKTSKWEEIETRRKERVNEKVLSAKIDTSLPHRVIAVSSLLKKVSHDRLCQHCQTRYEIGIVPYILKRTKVRPEHEKIRFDPCAHYKSMYKSLSPIHVHGMLASGADFGVTFPLPTGFTKLKLNDSAVKREDIHIPKSSPYTRDSVPTSDIEGKVLQKTKRMKKTLNGLH